MKPATRFPRFQPRAPEPERGLAPHAAVWEAMEQRSPVGLFQTDAAGSCVYVNSRWCELTGLPAEEALGAGWARALHPEDRERVFAAWSQAATTASRFADEYRFLHPDGTIVWVYGQATPEVGDDGAAVAFAGSVTDVSERHLAEERLRESEAHLAALINQSISGIAETDLTGCFTLVNDRYCEITGYTRDELLDTMRMQQITHPDDLPRNIELFQQLVADGAPFAIEKRYVRNDGTIVWVNNSVSPIRDEEGRPRSAVAVVVDTTERKRAEDAVRKSERRLQLLADAMPQVVWVADPDGSVRYYNSRVSQFAGVTQTTRGRWDWQSMLHPDDLPSTRAAWQQAVRDASPYAQEHRILMTDGQYRWHLSRAVPILDAGGEIETWYGTATDIHEFKQAEIERRENEERLRLGIEVAGFALLEVDYAAGVIHLSAEAARLYGLGNDAVTLPRERVHATFHPDDRAELIGRIAISPYPDTKESYTTEYRVVWPSGEVRWLSVRKLIIFDRSGPISRPVRAMLAALDITERKRVEAERVAFVDAAAHDLRNPLTSLKAQAQLLLRRAQRGKLTDISPIESGLEAIDTAASSMVALIDEMMDAAHLRTGGSLELRLAPADLVALGKSAAEEIQRSTTRHLVRVEAALPALVGNWDEVRLGRVLGNLLGNAVKYSPHGGEIVVRLGREDDATGAWALLAVSDRGIGIPAADVPRLFEHFHRGGNVASIRGSGIGLVGAKQIVAQHGGTIAVESEEGRGSTFTVRLPLGETARRQDGKTASR